MFSISAGRLVMLYIFTKFSEIILNGIKVIEQTRFLYWKLQRGIIPQKNVGGMIVLISARRLVMLYICAKFREIILNGIEVIKRTRFLYWKLQRGIIPKNVGGVTVLNLCMSSGYALYFYQVLWNYLERYQSYRADSISILKNTKGNNSAKNVGGVAAVNLCTSCGHALYLCQVWWNYLERYQSYGADTNDVPLTDGRTDRRTDRHSKCRRV